MCAETCECGLCTITEGGTVEAKLPTFELSGTDNCNEFTAAINMPARLLAKLDQLPATMIATVTGVGDCSSNVDITYTGGGLIDGNAAVVTPGTPTTTAHWSGEDEIEGCDGYVIRWCVIIQMTVSCFGDRLNVAVRVGALYSVCAPEAGGPCGNGSCNTRTGASGDVDITNCGIINNFIYTSSNHIETCLDCTGNEPAAGNDGAINIDDDTGNAEIT